MREADLEFEAAPGGIASLLGAWDWAQVHAQVAREARGHVAFVGRPGVGKAALCNRLRGWPIATTEALCPAYPTVREDFGALQIVDLPNTEDGASIASVPDEDEEGWADPLALQPNGHAGWMPNGDTALLVLLLDGRAELEALDARWLSRLRATGRPLLVVADGLPDTLGMDAARLAALARRLAQPVVGICLRTGAGIGGRLVPRMLDVGAGATLAIARELPATRREAARRITARAAMISGLTGTQPVPLVDLPLQLAMHMKLVTRLGAIYASSGGRRDGRELLATVGGGLALRYLIQQAVKLVPGAGWITSGALCALTTEALGRAAVARLERETHGMESRGRRPSASTAPSTGDRGRRLRRGWRRLRSQRVGWRR